MTELGPFDLYRLPVVACASVTAEELVRDTEIHDWATVQVRRCGHTRDFVQSCQVCRDVMAVIGALDSGAPAVRVFPRIR